MKLIVGLGNPGEKYEKTRHNLGFMVVEDFLKAYAPVSETSWGSSDKLKSLVADIAWNSRKLKTLEKVILAKPKTYMNNSGMAVSLLSRFYKVSPSNIWIIHDEVDLPLGSMKIRLGGSAAGHHGVESIISALGSDKFWRFRMGIGQSKSKDALAKTHLGNTTEFVLKSFSGSERSKVKLLLKRGVKAIETALEKDMQSAMNQFNTK